MRTRFASAFLFLSCAVAVVGCGGGGPKLYPVEGTVTVDNEPLEGAMVSFAKDDGTLATGLTSASGKFKLLTNGKEGAPAGTYKVSVSKTDISKTAGAGMSNSNDPTKSYQEMIKSSGGKTTPKGLEIPKPKSEIPERYNKPGNIPDAIVPTSGPIPIELKSK